ncbi:MAG: hypothetical protein R2909_12860 [Gemmatimonadales bacterium]
MPRLASKLDPEKESQAPSLPWNLAATNPSTLLASVLTRRPSSVGSGSVIPRARGCPGVSRNPAPARTSHRPALDSKGRVIVARVPTPPTPSTPAPISTDDALGWSSDRPTLISTIPPSTFGP